MGIPNDCCSDNKLKSTLIVIDETNDNINNNPNVEEKKDNSDSLENKSKNLPKKSLNEIKEKSTKSTYKNTNNNNKILNNYDNFVDLENNYTENVIEKKDSDSLENNYKFLSKKTLEEVNERNKKNTIRNNNNNNNNNNDYDDSYDLEYPHIEEGIISSP